MSATSARTLQLLSLLQTHRFWPGTELAGRLEVSDRTLRRDVERLRELGYPVDTTRGAHGGYQLGAGAALPPLTIEEDEAVALVAALGAHAGSSGGSTADAALAVLSKVVQVLPRRLQRRAEAVRSATVSASYGSTPDVDAAVLGALALATRDHERVTFTYRAKGGSTPGEDTARRVEPHQLVTIGSRWYLLGYDLDRHDWRSFRLDRLRDPQATRVPFRPREIPGGDAGAYVRAGLSRREQGLHLVVDVDASPEHVATRIGPWATVVDEQPERVRLAIDANDTRWAMFGLGYLEAPFMLVEAPDEVREALHTWSERFASAR